MICSVFFNRWIFRIHLPTSTDNGTSESGPASYVQLFFLLCLDCTGSTGNHKQSGDPTLSGWWLTYPFEKYESQLGWSFPIYGKIKHVPNHQPDVYKSPTWFSVLTLCTVSCTVSGTGFKSSGGPGRGVEHRPTKSKDSFGMSWIVLGHFVGSADPRWHQSNGGKQYPQGTPGKHEGRVTTCHWFLVHSNPILDYFGQTWIC